MSMKITIGEIVNGNDQTIYINQQGENSKVFINHGTITVNGTKIYSDPSVDTRPIVIHGDVQELHCSGPCHVDGDVSDLDADGPVSCRDIKGTAKVDGPLTCGSIGTLNM